MSLNCCLTCSVNRWHESKEDGACVGGQGFLCSNQKSIEVKLTSCMSYCCHTSLSLHTCTQTDRQTGDVINRGQYNNTHIKQLLLFPILALSRLISTWYRNSIDSYISVSQQATEDSLHLCGGNILPSPTKGVAVAVSEIHVAIFIHHQHITWKTGRGKQTETYTYRASSSSKSVVMMIHLCSFNFASEWWWFTVLSIYEQKQCTKSCVNVAVMILIKDLSWVMTKLKYVSSVQNCVTPGVCLWVFLCVCVN